MTRDQWFAISNLINGWEAHPKSADYLRVHWPYLANAIDRIKEDFAGEMISR